MSDDAYRRAITKKEEISERLEEIAREREAMEAELVKLDEFIGMWHELTGTKTERRARPRLGGFKKSKKSRPKNPPREQVGDVVERILKQRGKPLPRASLFTAVKEAGLEIRGKDPEMVLSTMLWRMQERFVRLPKFGYWLTNEPYSPAGYYPEARGLI